MSIRALVVDDEKETLDLFCELLTTHNIQIVGKGHNGQEALFLFQKLKPDVVYLDVSMPVYDGLYALEKIREINPNAIVFLIVEKMSLKSEMKMNRLNPSFVFREPLDVDEIIQNTHRFCLPPKDELENMQKTMTTLALKNTLLELGHDELDKVISILQKDYNLTLDDCYDNPEDLKHVLQDLFGESYDNILHSLRSNMKEISSHNSTKNFISNLHE
ncbi:response regulator transcription factor [Nitrosopumilus sp.]|uniref:response regulator transcription factor n=1 Tax=Nitrosopumilus sp. TaxID=2024843 RepID=UPI003D0FE60D